MSAAQQLWWWSVHPLEDIDDVEELDVLVAEAANDNGRRLVSIGENSRQRFSESNENPHQGHRQTPEHPTLGITKARYMDPDVGGFLSRDSYLGEAGNPVSLHGYAYVGFNPATYIDPLGYSSYNPFSWLVEQIEKSESNVAAREAWQAQNPISQCEGIGCYASRIAYATDTALISGLTGINRFAYGAVLETAVDAGLSVLPGDVGESGAEGVKAKGEALGDLASDVVLGGANGNVVANLEKNSFELMLEGASNDYNRLRRGDLTPLSQAGALALQIGVGAKAGRTRASPTRHRITVESRSGSGTPTVSVASSARAAALRPGVSVVDEWAGSVGAARAHSNRIPSSLPTRFRGLTSLGNEAGSPMLRRAMSTQDDVARAQARGGAGDRGVAFFGRDNLERFYSGDSITIGGKGGQFFHMGLDDAARVRNASDAARFTGMAPSAQRAYMVEDALGRAGAGEVFGISFPTKGMKVRRPVAADANGWPHFRSGGKTAVSLPEGAHGGHLLTPVDEFVIPGGSRAPAGTVIFKVGESGEWIPLRTIK